MLYPYMSAYTHLLGLNRRPRSPWDEIEPPDEPGTGMGMRPWGSGASTSSTGEGEREGKRSGAGGMMRRPGMGQGLLAFGASMLEAAPRGDWGGGLARGAMGFSEGLAAGRERDLRERQMEAEEARRAAAEERAQAQEARAVKTHQFDLTRGNVELDARQDELERARTRRERTGKTTAEMVLDIQELAAEFPNDRKLQVMARRADGYSLSDDEDDLAKLDALYEQMTNEAYEGEDFAEETQMGIARGRAEIDAGVRSNPQADDRRADEQLRISRGHLAVAQRADERESKRLTPMQTYDRVSRIADAKFKAREEAHEEAGGLAWSAQKREQVRREVLAEAWKEYQEQIGTVYDFTDSGDYIE